jgi:hypothetical protein
MNDVSIIPAWVQGVYFLFTGIWPIVHIRSFMAVTGPKVDLWLVKTVGVIVTAIGATICLAVWRREVSSQTMFLATASAAGLMAIDVIYVLKGRISPIYLADAAVELVLVGGWVAVTIFRAS